MIQTKKWGDWNWNRQNIWIVPKLSGFIATKTCFYQCQFQIPWENIALFFSCSVRIVQTCSNAHSWDVQRKRCISICTLSDRLQQCDDRHHVPTWQKAHLRWVPSGKHIHISYIYIYILKMAIEIVDLPIKNGDFP